MRPEVHFPLESRMGVITRWPWPSCLTLFVLVVIVSISPVPNPVPVSYIQLEVLTPVLAAPLNSSLQTRLKVAALAGVVPPRRKDSAASNSAANKMRKGAPREEN